MSPKARELSRRERQIMEIIYARGEASASEVHVALPDSPSYSTVRALLRILEEKGFLLHREDGPRYVYAPTESREEASRSALQQMMKTFFDGSLANVVAALVDSEKSAISEAELDRLDALIRKARKRR